MSVPLTPETGLFPATFVPAFIEAPELEELVDDVMSSYDEFEPLQTAMREAGLRLAYVWETKPFDPLAETIKPHTIAKVSKASPLWRCLAAVEIAIQFRQPFWEAFTEIQRRAVVHHELTHIDVEEPDANGRLKLSIRPHDVEDFTLTMRRFGPVIPSRASFVKAYLDWQHEQERPEPTRLRTLADDVVDASINDAAAGGDLTAPLRELAESTGTDITISARGRSATIRGRKAAADDEAGE